MKITLGKIVATQGIAFLDLNPDYLRSIITRHANGDWGDDWQLNDESAPETDGEGAGRILSSYPLDPNKPDGDKIWIITEWDRSVTTLLLPEEY